MSYEWDPSKAIANIEKHGIDFADAVTVFDDFSAVTIDDPDYDEQRFITIAEDSFGRILVVAYTWRGDIIRIISARKATKRERKHYEE
ncbi:MAG: BrnT family toxin [Desulfobacterales bacterium]